MELWLEGILWSLGAIVYADQGEITHIQILQTQLQ